MKNLAIVALLFSAFVLTMSSCKKIEEPTSVDLIANAGKATVSGIAYAQLDESDSNLELAPAGTKVVVSVDADDFPGVSTASYSNRRIYYTATVDASGKWTVSVPAPKQNISATVHPQDFRSSYIDASDDAGVNGEFEADNGSVTIFEGAEAIFDLQYDRVQ